MRIATIEKIIIAITPFVITEVRIASLALESSTEEVAVQKKAIWAPPHAYPLDAAMRALSKTYNSYLLGLG